VPVEGPQLQYQAAIGLSSKQPGLRDEVDAVLPTLAPRIRELSAKYALAQGAPVLLAAAGAQPLALAEALAAPAAAEGAEARRADTASAANLGKGKEIFNGTCAHCHGPNGVVEDRKINLRRLQLKYGEQLEQTYFTTVNSGRPSKGMPAWKEVFTQQDLADILGYLRTIQEK
jgi:polar amino acid transport system substrate-binding protein